MEVRVEISLTTLLSLFWFSITIILYRLVYTYITRIAALCILTDDIVRSSTRYLTTP